MDRLALSGLVLVVAGIAGLLASGTVGTAYAARNGGMTYLVTLSRGAALDLVRATDPVTTARGRRMACVRLVAVGDLRLGLKCRERPTDEL